MVFVSLFLVLYFMETILSLVLLFLLLRRSDPPRQASSTPRRQQSVPRARSSDPRAPPPRHSVVAHRSFHHDGLHTTRAHTLIGHQTQRNGVGISSHLGAHRRRAGRLGWLRRHSEGSESSTDPDFAAADIGMLLLDVVHHLHGATKSHHPPQESRHQIRLIVHPPQIPDAFIPLHRHMALARNRTYISLIAVIDFASTRTQGHEGATAFRLGPSKESKESKEQWEVRHQISQGTIRTRGSPDQCLALVSPVADSDDRGDATDVVSGVAAAAVAVAGRPQVAEPG